MQLEGLLAIVELEGSFVLKKVAVGHGIVKLELCQQGKARKFFRYPRQSEEMSADS